METEGVETRPELASSDAEQQDIDRRARLEKTLDLLDKVRAILRRWEEKHDEMAA